jgi:hypothetical protein
MMALGFLRQPSQRFEVAAGFDNRPLIFFLTNGHADPMTPAIILIAMMSRCFLTDQIPILSLFLTSHSSLDKVVDHRPHRYRYVLFIPSNLQF